MKKREVDYAFFREICSEVCSGEKYLSMKNYIAHSDVSVYEHSVKVAEKCYSYAVRRGIKCDMRSLCRGALLHDYFLYDWHKNKKFTFHGFKHAKIALLNAEKDYVLNEKEKNMIKSHMFPLTLFSFPRCKEAWILTFFDKKCALAEIFRKRGKKTQGNEFTR